MKRNYLVIILILFLISINASGSIFKNTQLTNISTLSNDDNILYVGGIGANNYTKIQDAIDDALEGDTVFVYDDSSPYYENIQIDKSIDLIGENKDTTIIDGNLNESVISIEADFNYISGFSIQNGIVGIKTDSNNITITNNVIKDNYEEGVYLSESVGCTISYNIIVENEDGIEFENSNNNLIFKNDISNNFDHGIEIVSDSKTTENNIIEQNNIESNLKGIYLENSTSNIIVKNNFIDNQRSALFYNCKNSWDQNYWDNERLLPKVIFGKNQFGSFQLPWINIDWHPVPVNHYVYRPPRAIIDTNMGVMVLEIFIEEMPITSNNFKNLSDIDFFDGLVFHRVIDDFVIQGGGYYPDGTYKSSPFGTIRLETHPNILHVEGAISMARTDDPDSATSQFFICDTDQPNLDENYAAFGVIVEGLDVLHEIAEVETTFRYGHSNWPVDNVIINSITVEDW